MPVSMTAPDQSLVRGYIINGPFAHSLIWQRRDFSFAVLLIVILKTPKLCVLHLAPLQLDKLQGFHDDFSIQIFRVPGRNFDQTRGGRESPQR
ncbi:uncharacterized protein IAS62_005131 [Cryptococcus decagattii]|uniref:Uncharacterized protein n=1 Tax=Cryptococcus decagattii TaxID=1859122 RepID=A0ABZ2B0Z9_9TREE